MASRRDGGGDISKQSEKESTSPVVVRASLVRTKNSISSRGSMPHKCSRVGPVEGRPTVASLTTTRQGIAWWKLIGKIGLKSLPGAIMYQKYWGQIGTPSFLLGNTYVDEISDAALLSRRFGRLKAIWDKYILRHQKQRSLSIEARQRRMVPPNEGYPSTTENGSILGSSTFFAEIFVFVEGQRPSTTPACTSPCTELRRLTKNTSNHARDIRSWL